MRHLRTVPFRSPWLPAFVIAAACVARPAAAHPVPFSYLDLRLHDDAIDGSLVVHVTDAAHELAIEPAERLIDPGLTSDQSAALANLLASRLTVSADGRALAPEWATVKVLAGRQSLKLPFRLALQGRPGRLAVSADLFPYDPRHQTFVNIYDGDEPTQADSRPRPQHVRILHRHAPGIARGGAEVRARGHPPHPDRPGPCPVPGRPAAARRHDPAARADRHRVHRRAQHHAVAGRAESRHAARAHHRAGHRPEHRLRRARTTCWSRAPRARDVRAWIAFAFGFIHGFGFANVLREMGLPPRALGWSLFSFNLGVEIGQLLVVAVVATALAALRSRSEAAGRQLAVRRIGRRHGGRRVLVHPAGLLSGRDVMRRGMVLGMLLVAGRAGGGEGAVARRRRRRR